jgi:hypothetical protein
MAADADCLIALVAKQNIHFELASKFADVLHWSNSLALAVQRPARRHFA